jgi:hypothetical protein
MAHRLQLVGHLPVGTFGRSVLSRTFFRLALVPGPRLRGVLNKPQADLT